MYWWILIVFVPCLLQNPPFFTWLLPPLEATTLHICVMCSSNSSLYSFIDIQYTPLEAGIISSWCQNTSLLCNSCYISLEKLHLFVSPLFVPCVIHTPPPFCTWLVHTSFILIPLGIYPPKKSLFSSFFCAMCNRVETQNPPYVGLSMIAIGTTQAPPQKKKLHRLSFLFI